jgi:hypothetical protein
MSRTYLERIISGKRRVKINFAVVAKAEKDLTKAIAQEIEDALPTSSSGNV